MLARRAGMMGMMFICSLHVVRGPFNVAGFLAGPVDGLALICSNTVHCSIFRLNMTSAEEPVNAQVGEPSPEEDTESSGKVRMKEGMAGLAKGLAIIEAFSASTTR